MKLRKFSVTVPVHHVIRLARLKLIERKALRTYRAILRKEPMDFDKAFATFMKWCKAKDNTDIYLSKLKRGKL